MQFQMGQLEDILLYLKSWWWNTNIKQTGVILIWSCGMCCFYSNGFLLPSCSKLRNSKQELEELFPGQHSCCSLCWWLHTSTSQWWKASITYPGCATAISTFSLISTCCYGTRSYFAMWLNWEMQEIAMWVFRTFVCLSIRKVCMNVAEHIFESSTHDISHWFSQVALGFCPITIQPHRYAIRKLCAWILGIGFLNQDHK